MSDKIIFGEKKEGVVYTNRPGAYVIIFENNKVALVKTSTGYFLPGGGIDNGESHKECLYREAIEELGWEIEIGDCLGNALNFFFATDTNKDTIMDGHFYLGKKIKEIAAPTAPDHQTVWLNYQEAIDKMWHPSQSWAIKEAYKKISQ